MSPNNTAPLISRRLFAYGLVGAAATVLLSSLSTTLAFAEPTSAEKQAEADAISAKLRQWEAELAGITSKYLTAMDAHQLALDGMDEAQGRVDAAQAIIASTQIKLGSRASNMYKNGPLTFIDVLFGASSFTEFTTRWDLLNTINLENADLISANKAAKDEATTAREDYAQMSRIAAEELAEAERQKASMEQIVQQYEGELSSLNSEIVALIQREQEAELNRQAELLRQQAEAEAARTADPVAPPVRSPEPAPEPPPGANAIVAAAYSAIGVPYVWAGTSPSVGFDCSGLTQWCYAQAGISIPHNDFSQYSAARAVLPVSAAQPGDILWTPGHVGIALGDGSYIHAPQPGEVVCIAYHPLFSHALRF